MTDTRSAEQILVEKETSRTIKQLLTIAEELGRLEPAQAVHPYLFDKYREQIMRLVWNNGKLWRRYGAGTL